MYHVTINQKIRGKLTPLDAKGFEFGEWNEIGFWLDERGYNEPRFVVTIAFSEMERTPFSPQV